MHGLDAGVAARVLLVAGRTAEALALLDAAIVREPESAALRYLRGEALFLERRIEAALACYAEAARLATACGERLGDCMSGAVPGDFAWMGHMLRGDFAAAWRLSDAALTRRAGASGDVPRHLRAVWDGTPLDGRAVVVRCYHGLGDTIQFVRFAAPLARVARRVVIEAQPELAPLLAGPHETVSLGEQDLPPAAYGCEAEIDAGELPHALRASVTTIPSAQYLRVDPDRVAAARRLLGPPDGRLRVGFVWRAGGWKPERSLPEWAVSALAATPGVAPFALQLGGGAGLPDLSHPDPAEAGARMMALDLVVSVDTMAAHLAGALGVPVWTMLHFASDWRWMRGRDDSPWYPSMRLFRQARAGDWSAPVAALRAALIRRARPGCG